METGVHGLFGKLAARHVEVEPNLENVYATIHHHQMVELLVLEAQLNPKHAMQQHALLQRVRTAYFFTFTLKFLICKDKLFVYLNMLDQVIISNYISVYGKWGAWSTF